MKKIYFVAVLLLTVFSGWTQVGINRTIPGSMLDINGFMKSDGSLFLENPGDAAEIRSAKLLIKTTANEVIRYDIDVSKYGPLNYAEFVFRNLSKDGLQDYDTKISTTKYIVTVQGYYYLEAVSDDTDVMAHSNISNENVEGYQIYAYKNSSTNTWFLRAFVNNAEFHTKTGNWGSNLAATPVDMYLNLVIYRNDFITKAQNIISINMGNSETGTAPLPNGF